MLDDDIIINIGFPFVSPAVFCQEINEKKTDNPEAGIFTIYYRKLNVIILYTHSSISVIGKILAEVLRILTLCSPSIQSNGYFQNRLKQINKNG